MRIPQAVHELVEWEIEVAYHQGYRAALADVAAGHAELEARWRPVGRLRYECQVAARLAEMQRHAQRLRAELDRAARPVRAARPGRGARPADWPEVAVPGLPTVTTRSGCAVA
ncbi:MAG TPA: hypothetical protein VGP31_10095 [Planosporangium sp.]|jgi:hypothetical protein|nr:hypothetical protein [Planosporangium sp.]